MEETGSLGMLLHACDQYAMAAACYRRAARMEPDSLRWPYYLALAEAAGGKKIETAASLQQALLADPSYLPAQLKLAETLSDIGKRAQSLEVLREITGQHPDSAIAHYELGRARTAEGRPLEAIQSLEKACELFPGYGVAHYALAMLYRDQGLASKAQREMALFGKFQQQQPPLQDSLLEAIHQLRFDPKDHLSRGIELLENDRLSDAIGEFNAALEQDPALAEAHGNLLSAYLRLGDFAKAKEHYLAAVALDPNMYETYFNFGLLCSQSGENDKAAAAFRRALEINPFFAEAHNNLGFLLANEGEFASAIDHFEAAIKNQPGYPDAHFNLGQVLLAQGRTEEAIPHLAEASSAESEQAPLILFTLAQAYLKAGKTQKSLDTARKAKQQARLRSQTELLADIDKFLVQVEPASTLH